MIIKKKKLKLPPDPEELNDERAGWAQTILNTFRKRTRADAEDALSDLLADLMHWCDRNDTKFDAELRRAASHYDAETSGEGPQQILNADVGYCYEVQQLIKDDPHGEHSSWTHLDWCEAVGTLSTQLGYWEWVSHKLDGGV